MTSFIAFLYKEDKVMMWHYDMSNIHITRETQHENLTNTHLSFAMCKALRIKTFGQKIYTIVISVHFDKLNVLIIKHMSDKMIFHLNVFHFGMKHRITC